jgi:TRAP-type C4-dicarboxylate transport system permease small subunit
MPKQNIVLKLAEFMARLAEAASVVCLAFVMLTIVLQVILRFFFKSNLPWVEEVSRYLMIWIVMIISSVLVKEDKLIKVDFFDSLWPENFVKYRDLIYQVLLLVLFVVLLKEGWSQAIYGLRGKITSMNISWFWPYLAIPFGMALILLQFICMSIAKILRLH